MFFSVKVPMRIGAKVFRTCICYSLTENLKSTIVKLANEGKAEIYTEQKFFCNGKLVDKKTVTKTSKKKTKKVETEAMETTEETKVTEVTEG